MGLRFPQGGTQKTSIRDRRLIRSLGHWEQTRSSINEWNVPQVFVLICRVYKFPWTHCQMEWESNAEVPFCQIMSCFRTCTVTLNLRAVKSSQKPESVEPDVKLTLPWLLPGTKLCVTCEQICSGEFIASEWACWWREYFQLVRASHADKSPDVCYVCGSGVCVSLKQQNVQWVILQSWRKSTSSPFTYKYT